MSYDTGLSMEERVSSLFQPDTLLPDQYLDTYRRKVHLEPEKKLMLAILEDAIACFQKWPKSPAANARLFSVIPAPRRPTSCSMSNHA